MLRSLLPTLAFAAFASSAVSAQTLEFCVGDGTQIPTCPCSNPGIAGYGCDNSWGTGGARLSVTGTWNPDTIVFTSIGEGPSVLSILYQADNRRGSSAYGDGIQCLTGTIRKLFVKHASAGSVTIPGPGDLSITARSAALGDPISPGLFRYYHIQYRDKHVQFCPPPQGGTWNATNAVMIHW